MCTHHIVAMKRGCSAGLAGGWQKALVSVVFDLIVQGSRMAAQSIIVYGTNWCPDCRRAQRVLDQHGVQYTYINIENDPAATEFVIKVNKGHRSVPTIVFPDGSILVEPSNAVLQARLQQLVS